MNTKSARNDGRPALVAGLLASIVALPGLAATVDNRPRLVLVLSVDQMRADYMDRFRGLFTGGLKDLAERGAVFTEARFRHSCTETGPGHSVILSGHSPRYTGIVANDWLDPLQKVVVNVVGDPVQETLGGDAPPASPANFLGSTLGDVLKKNSPLSRVVGVSMKDRSAILMAGRRADGAYWYSPKDGHFVTSTYYAREVPPWLQTWNEAKPADAYMGKPWNRLLEDTSLYEKYAGPDLVQGESDGSDQVFPHSIARERFYTALRVTPFMDELTLEVALKAMDAHELGRRGATDILAVGFSATDVIGHAFGPDSQEVMDQVLRLDRLLARLFSEVESRVGKDRFLIVLTADHGVLPLVEVLKARGVDARRVTSDALRRPVEEALAKSFPKAGKLLLPGTGASFYFDLGAMERDRVSREAIEETAREALRSTGLVEAVYTKREMLSTPPPGDSLFELFRNNFFESRSPDLMVSTKPNILVEGGKGGTGHGTAHEYDRHVPLVFLGPGIPRGTFEKPCGPEDIAPTLGSLLGIDYPPEEGSRVLVELTPR